MEITNAKWNSLPEQVQENKDNIQVLKEITSTPAVIYNATVEIDTGDGNVDTSNIIETVETTKNAYVLDTVGSLFKIISMTGTTVYILYVASIRGTQGATGANGADGVSITDVKVLLDGVVDGQNVYRVYVYLSNSTVVDSGTITLNEPQVEWKSATSNSDYVDSSARLRYFINGNICTVIMTAYKQKNVAVAQNTVLYTGLPKAISISGGLRFCVVSQDAANVKPVIRLNINNDGEILFDESTALTNTGTYYGCVTYVIDTEA